MRVRLDENLFTGVYWKLQEANSRFVLNYGGAGSSKSWSQGQHELIKALQGPQKTLVIRKYATTLDDSVVNLIRRDLIEAYGLQRLTTYNKTKRNLQLANGSEFLFRGLDDPEKLKSIQGVTRIWVEEASELEYADFKQLNLRMRGSDNLQMTLTFNPISEEHWIKKELAERPDVDVIHSTYNDNRFIDEEYKQQMERLKDYSPDDHWVYALGNWGRVRTGYEFYKNFTGSNIGECEYNPEQPLHISFDFNVNPYMTLTIYQVSEKNIWQIDEICPGTPNNHTEAVCKMFMKKYGEHQGGVMVYGDPSGKAKDTRSGDRNDFSIIFKELSYLNPKDRVERKAQNVVPRGQFINAILAGWNGFHLTVDNECKKSIEDLRSVKENADGTKMKEKGKDKETGVTVEKYGHTSDSLDYFICSAFKSELRAFQRGGKPVQRHITTRQDQRSY